MINKLNFNSVNSGKSLSRFTLVAAICVLLLVSVLAMAQSLDANGLTFEPLKKSVKIGSLAEERPFALPSGFDQQVIIDESLLDIYPGRADMPDMISVNETGIDSGRYLFRTHEVRPKGFNAVAKFKQAGGGAISVYDFKSASIKVLAQRPDWEVLDGLLWTPWGTLLFGEEVVNAEIPDPQFPKSKSGFVYELEFAKDDPSVMRQVHTRALLGSLSHEGIEVDRQGNVYVIDEYKKGSIYKFVPKTYGDLSQGQLYVLRIDANAADNGTGKATWQALDMREAVMSARQAAAAVNATEYGRPEDLEIIGDILYVAITSEYRVLSITLSGAPVVREFVKAGVNVPKETLMRSGFEHPDNLANDAEGNLWIIEDNKPSDVWVAKSDSNDDGYADSVDRFASLSAKGAEATGLYFPKHKRQFYINVQHTDSANDKTIAISQTAAVKP